MSRAALVIVCALASSACIVQKGGNAVDPNAAIVNVTWSVRSVAGIEAACPDGITVAKVIAQPVDATAGTPSGAAIDTLFDCQAKSGTISLVPDSYILSVRLQSADAATVYADSLPSRQLDLAISDSSESFTIFTDGGYLQFGWELDDKTGAQLTCEAASVADLLVVLTPTSGSGAAVTTTPLPCVAGTGTTSVIPAGDYALSIKAVDSGTTRGTVPVAMKTIAAPNQVAGLGTVMITVGP